MLDPKEIEEVILNGWKALIVFTLFVIVIVLSIGILIGSLL